MAAAHPMPGCWTPSKIESLSFGQFSGTRGHRRELLRQVWKDVGKVFILAAILDVAYQLIVHRRVNIVELLITAVTLAIVHVLVRGPISRITKIVFAARHAMKRPSIQ